MSTTVKFKNVKDSDGEPLLAYGRNGMFPVSGLNAFDLGWGYVALSNRTSKDEGGKHSVVFPTEEAVNVAKAILKEAGKKMPLSKRDRQLRKLGLAALELMRRVGDYGDLSAADYVSEMCSEMTGLGFKDEDICSPDEMAARSES